jgi:exopolysaccharide biosynthesis protein
LLLLAAVTIAVIMFAARASIERRLVQSYLEQRTGASVTFDGVNVGYGVNAGLRTLSIDGLHIARGAAELEVPHADVSFGGPLEILVRSPHLAFPLPPADGSDGSDPTASTVAWLRGAQARVRVFDGRVDIVPPADVSAALLPVLHTSNVAGTLALEPQAAAYDLSGDLVGDGRTYPFAARAASRGGSLTGSVSAPALPAAPFAALAPSLAAVTGGELHDVALAFGDQLRADATLVDVDASFGAYRLRGLRGPLALRGDRLGTPGLDGFLGRVPLSVVGEIHDLREPAENLRTGTRELAELDRLLAAVAAQRDVGWAHLETTAPGIAFAQYGARAPIGPRVISVLIVDPKEPSLRLGTAISSDHVISKGERTSQLAQRTGAVAGVNGDYFDIGRSYEPQGLLIRDGTIVRGPTDRAALVLDRANNVRFAEFHLDGSVRTRGRTYPMTQINTWPPGRVTLVTPDYGATLPPAPATFVRLAAVDAARHLYRATAVESAAAGLRVSFGVAFGPLVRGAAPRVGDLFRINYHLAPPVTNVAAGIGGGPILLKDGRWYEDPHAPAPAERDVRWPVVAFGSTAAGLLLFAAVDGRHPERAVGMTRPEFAALLRSYGVRDAMAFDSGGSVTLVARAPGEGAVSVRNTPSDDSAERFVSDALLVFSSAPRDEIVNGPPSPAPPVMP